MLISANKAKCEEERTGNTSFLQNMYSNGSFESVAQTGLLKNMYRLSKKVASRIASPPRSHVHRPLI